MQGQDRSAEKTFAKPEPTEEQHEMQLVKFCFDVSHRCEYPEETRTRARKLFFEWGQLQMLSPAEQQVRAKELHALVDSMEEFRNETQ